MEERKDVACQKLVTDVARLKKKEKKRIGGRKRSADEGQIFEQRFFFSFIRDARFIYRGRQRRQKFASTAKGDQPFEGSTFLPSFFFSSFFFTPENCSLKDE